MSLRVRQVLDGLHPSSMRALACLLPPAEVPAAVVTHKYPSAILRYLRGSHSMLGILSEELLTLPHADITLPTLLERIKRYNPLGDTELVSKSKTTTPFLDLLARTRKGIASLAKGSLAYNTVLSEGPVQGHPDIRTPTQVFEVKVTGQLAKNLPYFLCQACAYAALDPAVTTVYLILPLQAAGVIIDVAAWANRKKFKELFFSHAEKQLAVVSAPVSLESLVLPLILESTYAIGRHVGRAPALLDTVKPMGPTRPYQIFLASPRTNKIVVKDADVAAAAAVIASKGINLFIHAPYIINLAARAEDDYAVTMLKRNLEVGVALGAKGVVVHVGKSLGKADTLKTMRESVERALEAASAACPLLLETPAGQGTEMLTDRTEFIEFVRSFHSDRIAICVDTCHVFACGHNPLEYINAVEAHPHLLKLLHYNDSMDCCGSCKDRHAAPGRGKIGADALLAIAERASALGVPMIHE